MTRPRASGWFPLLLGVAVVATLASTTPLVAQDRDGLTAGPPSEFQVFDFEPTEDTERGRVTFTVHRWPERSWTVQLDRVSLRADDFRVLVARGQGLERVPREFPICTWRGEILEEPGSHVRATIRDGRVRGIVYLDDEVWALQPAADFNLGGGSSAHVLYPSDAWENPGFRCAGAISRRIATAVQRLGEFASGMTIADLAIDVDHEFYEALDSNVTDTVLDVEAIINALAPAFEVEDIGVTFELTVIVIRASEDDDPYTETSPGELLTAVEDVWAEEPERGIRRDLCHLFTGKDLDGSTIGLAGLGVVCDDEVHYGLSQSLYTETFSARVALTSHEIGHNWNATHCDDADDCQIMCSVITGCTGVTDGFGPDALDDIGEFAEGRNCLRPHQPAQELPFEEEFPDPQLDWETWLYNFHATVSEDGESEPSEDYALELNASGDGAYQDDEVRSVHLLLADSEYPTLEYWTQHVGVEEDEVLIVEYLNSELSWEELASHASDGTDQDEFVRHFEVLPANARHDQFRLRLRVDVDATDDTWYIDDIRIEDHTEPPEIDEIAPPIGHIDGGERITILGAHFIFDATVQIGDQELEDVVFISDSELEGTVPGVDETGAHDVVVEQNSGTATLSDGFQYVDFLMVGGDVLAQPDSDVWMTITGSNSVAIEGFATSVDFDPSMVEVVELSVEGTECELADVFLSDFDNDTAEGGGWWTAEVTLDFSPPFDKVIPAGDGNALVRVLYRVAADAEIDKVIPLPFSEDFDEARAIRFKQGPDLVAPTTIDGQIRVTDDIVTFVRGDMNSDELATIGDAISILRLQFDKEEADCWDAADVNDDGTISIGDPLRLLFYLFMDGTSPAPPYPDPGVDPTDDDLDCDR